MPPTMALSLDIGTSSCRSRIYDLNGAPFPGSLACRSYSPESPEMGASELHPDELLESAAKCLDETLSTAGLEAESIVAVGCCALWHSMVGVDSRGEAITPVYTWADTRPASVAGELAARISCVDVHARTGCVIHPSYFPARLLWHSQSMPDIHRKVVRWLSPAEYLYLKLFGKTICSISMASGTGLFNQNACCWDIAMMKEIGITPAELGPLARSGETLHGLLPEWAERWPALADIPWVPAIGDGAASNLGSDCRDVSCAAINLGTSGAIRVLWEQEEVKIPDDLWCYRLDNTHFVMGAAFSDGGNDYAWARRILRLPDDAEIERQLLSRKPGQHALMFLPWLHGERSPDWNLEACASLIGMSMATEPLDILQAIMEGVALQFMLAWRTLAREFPQISHIKLSGGAPSHSIAWSRMIADAIGMDLIRVEDEEASLRGAALYAFKNRGYPFPITDSPGSSPRIVSDSLSHEYYLKRLQLLKKCGTLLK